MLYSSTQHAREWISTEVNRRRFEAISTESSRNAVMRRVLEHLLR